jgi:hypothetical protein
MGAARVIERHGFSCAVLKEKTVEGIFFQPTIITLTRQHTSIAATTRSIGNTEEDKEQGKTERTQSVEDPHHQY